MQSYMATCKPRISKHLGFWIITCYHHCYTRRRNTWRAALDIAIWHRHVNEEAIAP